MKRLLFALMLFISPAHAQNVLFPANPGDMIVKGNAGAWVPVHGGTAGCVLTSNGPAAAPTWNCALALNFQLPPMPPNTVWGNVTATQAAGVPIDVNQFLNTIDYDIQRTPLPGSVPYKGTDNKWHTAPPAQPGWAWTSQGAGVIPQWAPVNGYIPPGAVGTCLVSNGPSVAPSYATCPTSGSFPVDSVFGRTGTITAQNGDYTVGQVTGAAPLASPALTGVPTAPTAAPGTNTTQLATTAFVQAAGTGVTSFNSRTGVVTPGANDYTAATINYTAPGTGGTALTQAAHNQNMLWVNDYGAVCDAATNDATSFQNMNTEAIALRAAARFRGACKINTALPVPTTLDFGGTGIGYAVTAGASTGGSRLIVANNVNGFNVSTDFPVTLHDFSLETTGGSSGKGINLTSAAGLAINVGTIIERMTIVGFATSVYAVNGAGYIISHNQLLEFTASGVHVEDQTNPDGGDSLIEGNTFSTSTVGALGIDMISSGGLKVFSNKFNGSYTEALRVTLANGVSTGGLQFSNNNVEGALGGVRLLRAGATGTYLSMVFTGNYWGVSNFCVFVPNDPAGVWIDGINISSNQCRLSGNSTPVAFSVDSVNNLTIGVNSVSCSGTPACQAVATGAAVTGATIGPISKSGTFGASALLGTAVLSVTCSATCY